MKGVNKFQETEFRGLDLNQEQLDLLGSRKAVNSLVRQTTSAPRRSVMPSIDPSDLELKR
jgi:hypothetical protein